MDNKKLRIAIITPDYPPNIAGGCAISSSILARQLRSRGYNTDVHVFSSQTHKPVISNNGTNYYYRSWPKLFLLNNIVIFICLFWKLHHYNIIHIYNVGDNFGTADIIIIPEPCTLLLLGLGGLLLRKRK